MKTVSQKDLDKLVKEKGWKLTPDSKKAIREQKAASMLSKQVEVITSLVKSVDSVKDVLRADTGKDLSRLKETDYTVVIGKLIESIRGITIPQAAVTVKPEPDKGWKFVVTRNHEGLIKEILAEKFSS